MAWDDAVLRKVRVAAEHDLVYKDECMWSFDSVWSPDGLYTSLTTWRSIGHRFAVNDGVDVFLWQRWRKVVKDTEEDMTPDHTDLVPTKLAIGVEGGFSMDPEGEKFRIEKDVSIVMMPQNERFPFDSWNEAVPEVVVQAASAILNHPGSTTMQQVQAWQEEIKESRYARDLAQLDNGKRISPDSSQWKCEESGRTDNLWLNLSTGFVGSGRSNWDGTGGTGAALRHYEETGRKYPLAVKLGTITRYGADVFSYAPDEDDMVMDPLLSEHLQHWGINMMEQEKTEKTMAELQIDLNHSYEFDKITEASRELTAIHGPGFVGLENLGNTCYMNSVLQILFSLPETRNRYLDLRDSIRLTAPTDPSSDVPSQMAKLAEGLLTNIYVFPENSSLTPAEAETARQATLLRPNMFRSLVAKDHSEFASNHQQDALEYLQYLLEIISRSEKPLFDRLGMSESLRPLNKAFTFEVETRLECIQSGRVKYQVQTDNVLSLNIPTELATNKQQVMEYADREFKRQKLKEASVTHAELDTEEPVKLRIPLLACLENFGAREVVDDFYSAALKAKTQASRILRMKTFPPYLILHLKRYYRDADWTEKKLDVLVEVTEALDLQFLRGYGKRPGEMVLSDEENGNAGSIELGTEPNPNAAIVAQLVAMGFTENGSKRATLATGNIDAETALSWILEHMNDADFNDPLPERVVLEDNAEFVAEPSAVSMLVSMGFTERQATGGLKACEGSLERAADWLYSRMDSLDAAVEEALNGSRAQNLRSVESRGDGIEDGSPSYSLMGIISHIGSNTACGHYVAHIKKGGRWILFNDGKVGLSKNPPLELGYLYVYSRALSQ